MSVKLPYRISARSASVFLNGKMRTVSEDSANYPALVDELRKPEHNIDRITELADMRTFIAKFTFGEVALSDDAVFWKGIQLHGVIVDRMLAMLRNGDDLEPLSLFLGKLMNNPTISARNELYQWLEAGDAPICPDGDFLAFKRVRANYTDCHSGKMDNSVGKIVEMPRSQVDTNRDHHCSRGLHFCQHDYLRSFRGERTVIVKVSPTDVVSIPTDYKFQKGRAWRYEVVGEVSNDTNVSRDTFKGTTVDKTFSKKGDITLAAGSEDTGKSIDTKVTAPSVDTAVTEKEEPKNKAKKDVAKKTPAKKSGKRSTNKLTKDERNLVNLVKKHGSVRAAARHSGISRAKITAALNKTK